MEVTHDPTGCDAPVISGAYLLLRVVGYLGGRLGREGGGGLGDRIHHHVSLATRYWEPPPGPTVYHTVVATGRTLTLM